MGDRGRGNWAPSHRRKNDTLRFAPIVPMITQCNTLQKKVALASTDTPPSQRLPRFRGARWKILLVNDSEGTYNASRVVPYG